MRGMPEQHWVTGGIDETGGGFYKVGVNILQYAAQSKIPVGMRDNLFRKERKGAQEGHEISDDAWRRGRGHRDENDEVPFGNNAMYRLRNESIRGTAHASCLGGETKQSRLRMTHDEERQ